MSGPALSVSGRALCVVSVSRPALCLSGPALSDFLDPAGPGPGALSVGSWLSLCCGRVALCVGPGGRSLCQALTGPRYYLVFVLARAAAHIRMAPVQLRSVCHPASPRSPAPIRAPVLSSDPCYLFHPAGPQLRSACPPIQLSSPSLDPPASHPASPLPVRRCRLPAIQLRSACHPSVPPIRSDVPPIQPRCVPFIGFCGPQLRSACHPSAVVGIPGMSAGCPPCMSAGCPPSCHPQTMIRSPHREDVQPLARNADADTGQFHRGKSSPTVVCTRLSPVATSLLLRTRLLCRLPSQATTTNDALSNDTGS